MKASRWVLGLVSTVVILAGCRGSSGQSTITTNTIATETFPIPVDTFAPTTTQTTTTNTTPPSTTVAPNSEEALRARVLEFSRLFVDTDLSLPAADLMPLFRFFVSEETAADVVGELSSAISTGGSTKRNDPVIDEITVGVAVVYVSGATGSTTSCITNNHIAMAGGPDGLARTQDDVVESDKLETQIDK